jgi:hypothetical protein
MDFLTAGMTMLLSATAVGEEGELKRVSPGVRPEELLPAAVPIPAE